jgi:hypothetical protein
MLEGSRRIRVIMVVYWHKLASNLRGLPLWATSLMTVTGPDGSRSSLQNDDAQVAREGTLKLILKQTNSYEFYWGQSNYRTLLAIQRDMKAAASWTLPITFNCAGVWKCIVLQLYLPPPPLPPSSWRNLEEAALEHKDNLIQWKMFHTEILYTSVLYIWNKCFVHNYGNTSFSEILSVTNHFAHKIRFYETFL